MQFHGLGVDGARAHKLFEDSSVLGRIKRVQVLKTKCANVITCAAHDGHVVLEPYLLRVVGQLNFIAVVESFDVINPSI